MAKVDKRAAGHSTKHEIPVPISADTKMVDTKFVCTVSTCIRLCKTQQLPRTSIYIPFTDNPKTRSIIEYLKQKSTKENNKTRKVQPSIANLEFGIK